MTDSSSQPGSPEPLNDLDLSGIDPALLQPVSDPEAKGTAGTLVLLLLLVVGTGAVSLDASQRWLTLQIGSIGSVLLPLGLGFATASIAWRLLERRALANRGKASTSVGEKLMKFTRLEPWIALFGLGGALALKVTGIAKGYEVGIGLMAVVGGLAGALWLSRQIERRVDP